MTAFNTFGSQASEATTAWLKPRTNEFYLLIQEMNQSLQLIAF